MSEVYLAKIDYLLIGNGIYLLIIAHSAIVSLFPPEKHGFDWRNFSLIVCVIRVFSIPLRDN